MSSLQYPEPIAKLIASYMKLPGIGEKTATRLAFYTMNLLSRCKRSRLISITAVFAEILRQMILVISVKILTGTSRRS